MESDAYEEDDNSDYMWEGERLSWVVCSNYKDRFLKQVEDFLYHSKIPL